MSTSAIAAVLSVPLLLVPLLAQSAYSFAAWAAYRHVPVETITTDYGHNETASLDPSLPWRAQILGWARVRFGL